MSLANVTEELADVLRDAFSAVTDIAIQVEPRRLFNPSPPSVDIYPADPFRSAEEAGWGDISGACLFTIRARVHTADNDASQDILLDMMDDGHALCVAAAILADPTLNGWAQTLDVDGPSGHRVYVDPGGEGAYLGVEWTVRIIRVLS